MHVATFDEIRAGKVTDIYFVRAQQILRRLGKRQRVTAEFVVKTFPYPEPWGVAAGLEEAVELLQTLPRLNVWAMPEGTLFGPHQPILVIEGRYLDFGIYETALLGFLCQASGIATKAARCRKAAGERAIISFGARRIHPALAPMVERSAYIGGCDGVATVASAELLGMEPTGTVPHALILLVGDSVKALKAFDRIIDRTIKRVALVDTLGDEKFEAMACAQALGRRLYAVRLDTPASRRGDLLQILREVRWELDLRGHQHVKLFVSGGLDEHQIQHLNPLVDAYGVGTALANAPVLDLAMDLVAIEGRASAKRGKLSGTKQVYRCPNCLASTMLPRRAAPPRALCRCRKPPEPLLEPVLQQGRRVAHTPTPAAIRRRVLDQLTRLPDLSWT